MAKKTRDFSAASAQDIYSATIAEATQDAPDAQEKRKERKTYTAQEKHEYMQSMSTAGRKGLKLPRINVAFSPDVYDYVRTMARAAGLSYTQFINVVLQEHKKEHESVYKQAVKIRNSL